MKHYLKLIVPKKNAYNKHFFFKFLKLGTEADTDIRKFLKLKGKSSRTANIRRLPEIINSLRVKHIILNIIVNKTSRSDGIVHQIINLYSKILKQADISSFLSLEIRMSNQIICLKLN